MKKTLLFVSANLLAAGTVMAQLPVSTSPQYRKVVLEEFTGKTCQYCPDGHKRADELAAANPGEVFVINIHAGSYAGSTPDYKTPFGAALASQSGLTGYPAGSVNRQVFPGMSQNTTNPGTAMSRSKWVNAASQVLSEQSYVNVALEATIDELTREMVVNVETYYTGASPAATNYLHVALVEDSIMGPQTGASTWYPAMLIGGLYQHNKMLRHLLTGQTGEQITTTTAGSLVAKQYTYTIPAMLPLVTSGTNTDVNLKKLRLIAFVTETNQYIVSGNTGPISFASPLSAEAQLEQFKFNVYPNPTAGTANISFTLEKEENVKVSVINMLGMEVYSSNQKLQQGINTLPFNGANLSDGMYNVRVKVGETELNKKFTLIK